MLPRGHVYAPAVLRMRHAMRDTIAMAARCDAARSSRMCHPISPFASHLCRTVMTVEDDHAPRTTLAQQTHACTQAHYACVQACQMRTPVWQVSLLIIDFIFISYFRERPRYASRITMWQWHETSAPGARGQGQAWHGSACRLDSRATVEHSLRVSAYLMMCDIDVCRFRA